MHVACVACTESQPHACIATLLRRPATALLAQIVWDVGHQAYGHKILTGRRSRMPTIRQTGGLSGIGPKPCLHARIYLGLCQKFWCMQHSLHLQLDAALL